MDNEMKRRTFLAGAIGALVGAPFAVRYYLGGKSLFGSNYRYERELKKYETLTDVPVQVANGPASINLALRPPQDVQLGYVLFLSAFLPKEMSQSVAGEADQFSVRKGQIYLGPTPKNQMVVVGGDEIARYCNHRGFEERNGQEVMLLVQDGKILPAKAKGTSIGPNRDRQLENLLALALPNTELKVGTKWTGSKGRVLPFTGYRTDYEIIGFAEVGGIKTVNIRFSGTTQNVAQLPGVNSQEVNKDQSMTNKHEGNAYFDLETGLLVRQETEMQPKCTGLPGDIKDFSGRVKMVVQMFHA